MSKETENTKFESKYFVDPADLVRQGLEVYKEGINSKAFMDETDKRYHWHLLWQAWIGNFKWAPEQIQSIKEHVLRNVNDEDS